MNRQVLPRFGDASLNDIVNSDVRRWVVDLMESGLSAATTCKAVFALRQALEAAIADQRLVHNAALAVPLPSERSKPPRYLSQTEVERLICRGTTKRSCPGSRGRLRRTSLGRSRRTSPARHRSPAFPHQGHRNRGRAPRARNPRQRAEDGTVKTDGPGRPSRDASHRAAPRRACRCPERQPRVHRARPAGRSSAPGVRTSSNPPCGELACRGSRSTA